MREATATKLEEIDSQESLASTLIDISKPAAPVVLLRVLFRSLTWAGAARALTAFGNAAKYAIFARLLTPFDLGVATTAFLTLDLLSACTNASFDKALIQEPKEITPFLDSVWTFTLIRGAALALILVACSRLFATFFHQSNSALVFVAVAPLALARAAQNPSWVSLYRNLEFHLALILNVAELAASIAIGVPAILLWKDWRGLVAATIAGQLARTLLSYHYFSYRPQLRFNWDHIRFLLRYGIWASVTSVMEFAAQQLDNFVAARVLGPSAVGNYQMAFRLGEMPATEVGFAASIVTFPMAARLRDNIRARSRLFLGTTALVAFAGLAYGVVLLGNEKRLITLVLGAQWLGAVGPLKFLAFYGLCQGILIIARSFLDGLGRPDTSLNMAVLRFVTLAILVYPLTVRFGLNGTALAALISVLVPTTFTWVFYQMANGRPELITSVRQS